MASVCRSGDKADVISFFLRLGGSGLLRVFSFAAAEMAFLSFGIANLMDWMMQNSRRRRGFCIDAA